MTDQQPTPPANTDDDSGQIGTDDQQTVPDHIPSVTEHNARMYATRPRDCIG